MTSAISKDLRATNLLKGFAIIAVVILHIASSIPHLYSAQNLNNIVIFDQLLRFCVPLFIGISGYSLYKRYETKIELGTYFKKRILRLLPQYLIWSLIFIFAMPFLYPAWGNPSYGISLVKTLILGKADYHLYFVPLIVQLYLLFPFLRLGMKKWPVMTLFFTALIQLVAYALLSPFVLGKYIDVSSIQDQNHYALSIFSIFYFGLGMWIAKKSSYVGFVIVAIVGAMLAIFNARQSIGAGTDMINALRFTRLPIGIYATGIIGLALMYKQKLVRVLGPLSPVIEKLGEESFLIFLSHTLLLRTLIAFVYGGASIASLVPALLLMLVGVLLSLRF